MRWTVKTVGADKRPHDPSQGVATRDKGHKLGSATEYRRVSSQTDTLRGAQTLRRQAPSAGTVTTVEPHEASIAPARIRAELTRLLASDAFQRAPRSAKLLDYLVRETLDGRGDRIKGPSIAMDVFGRDASFDSTSDPIVRVQAGRLRALLASHYAAHGGSADVVVEIPKGRYIPRFSAAPQTGGPHTTPETSAADADTDDRRGNDGSAVVSETAPGSRSSLTPSPISAGPTGRRTRRRLRFGVARACVVVALLEPSSPPPRLLRRRERYTLGQSRRLYDDPRAAVREPDRRAGTSDLGDRVPAPVGGRSGALPDRATEDRRLARPAGARPAGARSVARRSPSSASSGDDRRARPCRGRLWTSVDVPEPETDAERSHTSGILIPLS